MYEVCLESKDMSRVRWQGNFLCYYGNNAIDLNPLPVRHARLTVVEPALFERDMFEMAVPIQSPPNARCIPLYYFSMQKVNVQQKFTNKWLLFTVTL